MFPCIVRSNFTAPSLLSFSTKHAQTRLLPQDLSCISDACQCKQHILLLQRALVSEGVSGELAHSPSMLFLTSSALILSYAQILTKSSLFGVFIETVVYRSLKRGHITGKKPTLFKLKTNALPNDMTDMKLTQSSCFCSRYLRIFKLCTG